MEYPYHGWTFDGDGKCTRIPAQPPEAPIPRKARVDSYPTEERYGWVATWARERGVAHVFVEDLLERTSVEEVRMDTCCHYSAAGHARLATLFDAEIRQRLGL